MFGFRRAEPSAASTWRVRPTRQFNRVPPAHVSEGTMDIVGAVARSFSARAQAPRVVTVVAGIAALACAVLSVTGDAAGAAEARSSATSVIDRTYACPATLV